MDLDAILMYSEEMVNFSHRQCIIQDIENLDDTKFENYCNRLGYGNYLKNTSREETFQCIVNLDHLPLPY